MTDEAWTVKQPQLFVDTQNENENAEQLKQQATKSESIPERPWSEVKESEHD